MFGAVSRSLADSLAANTANVAGTLNVLEAAREAGVKLVIYTISSSVYRNTLTLPNRSKYQLKPTWAYAVSKRAALPALP